MSTLLAAEDIGGTITGPGAFATDPAQGAENFDSLASTIFGFLTIVAGLAFALYFLLGALSWVTAGGDQQKVQNAKNQMTNAAIGLIAVVASYAIIGIVGAALGIDILNPINVINSF